MVKQAVSTGKIIGGIVGVIVLVAAVVSILQFFGVTHIQDLFNRPEPTIAEATFSTQSPSCDSATDPKDITWGGQSVTTTCLLPDAGVLIAQKDRKTVGELFVSPASSGHAFAQNHNVTVTLTKLTAADPGYVACAGIDTRGNSADASSYAFYICGNGDWYIIKYSPTGTPETLLQSNPSTKEAASPPYLLVVTVDGSNLQMIVNNGQAHTVSDKDYTKAEDIAIVTTSESNLTNILATPTTTSVIAQTFIYTAL